MLNMKKMDQLKSAVMILRHAKDSLSKEAVTQIKKIVEDDINVAIDDSVGEEWEDESFKIHFGPLDYGRISLQEFISCIDPPPLKIDTINKINRLIRKDLYSERKWYERVKENIKYFFANLDFLQLLLYFLFIVEIALAIFAFALIVRLIVDIF